MYTEEVSKGHVLKQEGGGKPLPIKGSHFLSSFCMVCVYMPCNRNHTCKPRDSRLALLPGMLPGRIKVQTDGW